ncbi:hypothetical protein FB45DRAFT_1056423 [Roridomyces roridus]|uniref:Uncharacterized protein n=1 Tax=Roridomyces roridus TaxID=1738132 RepID=A0AAD7FNK1_9AGAR|nr:hypothetical protein FB45DRAFT_1056423 [Roridomyces roridus]
MIDCVAEHHLKYLMGHSMRSTHVSSTYQRPDRQLDVAGLRFSEDNEEMADLSALHSDPHLETLIKEYTRREALVWKSFDRQVEGKTRSVVDLWEAGHEDQVITEALEALSDLWSCYETLSLTQEQDTTPKDTANQLKLQQALFEQLAMQDSSHPILAIVAGETENSRLEVVRCYVAFMRMSKGPQKGACPYCLCDPAASEADAHKDHSGHFVQHIVSCELKHNPNTFRCCICKSLVPVPPRRSKKFSGPKSKIPVTDNAREDHEMDEEQRQQIQDDFDEHCAACFETLRCKLLGESMEDEDNDEEESDSEDEGNQTDVSMRTAPRSMSRVSDVSMGSVSEASAASADEERDEALPTLSGAGVLSIKIKFNRRERRPSTFVRAAFLKRFYRGASAF